MSDPNPTQDTGATTSPGPPTGTASVFISHVEEDRDTTEELARGLREHGFEAWAYETDTLPGPTYLSQVVEAIERASAVILVISPHALGSHQVAREIEVAHELDRPIIPVLKGITHEKFQKRRPDWRLALGGYTSVSIPSEGVPAIMPRIVDGLRALGVAPDGAPQTRPAPTAGSSRGTLADAARKPRNLIIAGALAAVALVAVLLVVLLAGGGSEESAPDRTEPSATTPAEPSRTPPASVGTDDVEATLEVEPETIAAGDSVTVTYSITNTSEQDIERATTQIVLVAGQSELSSNVIIGPIDKDIPAGKTVKGSLSSELLGVEVGPQKILMTMGRKIRGGTADQKILAEAPITVEG